MHKPAPEQLRAIEAYLASHDPADLKYRIEKYAAQSRKEKSREQIRREIYAVLTPHGGHSFVIPHSSHPILVGTPLFRARKIDHVEEMRVVSDVWNAPPKYVSPGRLNLDGESLLYTAVADPRTAAYEVRAHAGDLVAMSEYRVTAQFQAIRIGDQYLPEGLSLKGEKKLGMIMQFMQDIFTQRAAPEDSHKYVAPELLTKDFFDLPEEVFQAWSYTSIADPTGTGWNLCFRPALGRQLLEYVKTRIVRIESDPETGDETFRHVVLRTLVEDPGSQALVRA